MKSPLLGLLWAPVVTFTGTKHYISSMAVNGKSCKPGEAKVTAVAKSGKHPYHLIKTTGSSSTVYGWVDAADVKEVVPAIVKGSRVKVAKGQDLQRRQSGLLCLHHHLHRHSD